MLLVRNRAGWRNLLRLVNLCQLAVRENVVEIREIAGHSEGLTVILHAQPEGPALTAPAVCPRCKMYLKLYGRNARSFILL